MGFGKIMVPMFDIVLLVLIAILIVLVVILLIKNNSYMETYCRSRGIKFTNI